MTRETLRQRALEEALRDPAGHLERVRAKDRALARIDREAARRHKVAGPLGVLGLVGGGVLAALTAAAVIVTPVGWAAAAGAAALGLAGLGSAGAARRRARAAVDHRNKLRLGHAGRALEIDALLARLEAVRLAVATDYARYEQRVLAGVDAQRHAENAALLHALRARQLAHVRRLDEARDVAVALRERLVRLDIEANVELDLERLHHARDAWTDQRARNTFERDDVMQALARLADETDALEALEREIR